MDVLFVAPFNNFTMKDGGYGNASLGIVNTLNKMKNDADFPDLKVVDFISTVDMNSIRIPNRKYDVVILLTHPDSFGNVAVANLFKALLDLGTHTYLSIVWETEPLPKRWEWLWTSVLFTGFITPSYFVGNQIAKKTSKPVYYNPHYINTELFEQINIEEKLKEEKFTVLFMGQYTERKSIRESLLSFIRAMHVNDDAQLILKYHLMSQKIPIESLIREYISSNCSLWKASIYSLTDNLSNEDVIKLYKNSSVLLFPSKGEGFGLPIAEAMSIGIPVIYTNWSACPEIAEAQGNIPVDYYLDESTCMNIHGYEYGDSYAYPKMSSLTDAIRVKYHSWKSNKKNYYEKVSDNREIINKKFGYESIKIYMNNILNNKIEKRIIL